MRGLFPRVYPILDSSVIPNSGRAVFLDRLGRSMADAEVRLLEYRNKTGTDAEVLADARILRSAMSVATLIMGDRVDVAMAAHFDGVHVDGGDLSPSDARLLLGGEATIGTSASSEAELHAALGSGADYIAFGPVFPTTTKQTSALPIGIDGVSRFRSLARIWLPSLRHCSEATIRRRSSGGGWQCWDKGERKQETF
jgi:thiamine-phosphate pyrophosphorylase